MQDPLEEDSCSGLLLFDRVDVVNDATAIIRNDRLHPPQLLVLRSKRLRHQSVLPPGVYTFRMKRIREQPVPVPNLDTAASQPPASTYLQDSAINYRL